MNDVDDRERLGPRWRELLKACACPVDWKSQIGFDRSPSALAALNAEWVRSVAAHAVSTQEPDVVAWVVDEYFDRPAEEDIPQLIQNLEIRRQSAVECYRGGIGRLGKLEFLRPSHDGKHYAPRKAKLTASEPRSQFYVNLRPDTIGHLFWQWFDEMFCLDPEMQVAHAKIGPLRFARGSELLWRRFLEDTKVRIAMDATAPIGELFGKQLRHIAIDVHIDSGVAHAYPITSEEASAIMGSLAVMPIKSQEYGYAV